MNQPDVLPGPFGAAPRPATEPTQEIDRLVDSQITALLMASPAFGELPLERQAAIHRDLGKITGYTAALIQEDWYRSRQLGQTPVVRKTREVHFDQAGLANQPSGDPVLSHPYAADIAPAAPGYAPARILEGPAAEEWSPRSASQVARVTESTLNAIAFPTFVADLIKGTFNAIVDASIQQMEAFGELLSNVAKTVDDYMADNITDNSARDWLVAAFPRNYVLADGADSATLDTRDGLDEAEEARMRRTLNLPSDADVSEVEEVLVPASRRHLAQTRQQMLSSMVLMGINRIVVTRGRIRAQMGFRIDSKDYATASASERFDKKTEAQVKYGGWLSPVKGSLKTTVAYVSSNEKNSENELNVEANLTGEVDLQFKSDVFPLERFADAGIISTIQANTANPAANQPVTATSPT